MSAQSIKELLDRITPLRWMAASAPSSIVGWPIIGLPDGRAIANVHGRDDQAAANARAIALVPKLLAVAVAAPAILYMAEEWFKYGGDETTFADDFERELEAARSALAALDAKMKEMG